MVIVSRLSFYNKLLIFIIFSFLFISVESYTVIEISRILNEDYKTVSVTSDSSILDHFFKYTVTDIPKSGVGAFRINFDIFNDLSLKNLVFCTFVDDSTSDADLQEKLQLLTDENTTCIGEFSSIGVYDGIIQYDTTKKKLGIYLKTLGDIPFSASVTVRTTETFLSVKEQLVTIDETYSLVPFTVVISDFSDEASRILFYSYTRELQMYYIGEGTQYPKKLFSGNVMSVYTDPNMVHQKYHDANYMVLLTRYFSVEDPISESFKFEVKLISSNYLLDYYVSNDPNGRTKNSPLAINMTECGIPYYVILNYNKPEKQTSLYIDQIYGKIKSLSVAPYFTSYNWDDMIVKDMKSIQVSNHKYILPKESQTHMDVYKVECEIPILLNFYYIDESANIPELDYGKAAIVTLKAYETISLPFSSEIVAPELTIEIFNPVKLPFVIVNDGKNENIVDRNTLLKSVPFTTYNPIVVKERCGDTDTRVIIKVGYNIASWEIHAANVKYNSKLNMYVFSFPNEEKRLNYTFANLITSGIVDGDNVKFCYGTNIGSAILPSAENCYRVSKDNSYTLKFLNPLIMHKEYEINNDLPYYISIKPVVLTEKMEINPELNTYDTNERNIEGVGKTIKISSTGEIDTILTPPKNKEVIFLQVQQCDRTPIKIKVVNSYNNSNILVQEISIPSNSTNFYKIYNNILLETQLQIEGNSGTNVFVKHVGVRSRYSPSVKGSQSVTFNSELNQIIVENPLNSYEGMKYTVLVSPSGGLSSKGISLCSFVDGSIDFYNKTVIGYNAKTSITINFNKVGLNTGDKFEALVFTEEQNNSKMVFLSDIITDFVGDIKIETITEINNIFDIDNDYVYGRGIASPSILTYYFSYLPSTTFDVPVGTFTIEMDGDAINGFSNVDCAFVDDGEDAITMVQAIEDIIDSRNPYCTGGRSKTNERLYKYIFTYSYTPDKNPRKLVIKISNNLFAEGGFTIFVKKGQNTYIEKTDFEDLKEYGKFEEYKKSVIPYIIDLKKIRGDDINYISKMLIYSRFLEMQMYYIDKTEQINAPILLFTGHIMLVYTKLELAEQKYHGTKLILLSENIFGQEHTSLGNNYRFHTKMFESDFQIEYFVSNNPTGRTLNSPLSLEVNICNGANNKYYYILNYNKEEEERILYLDVVFGSMKGAKISNEINEDNWDSLIKNSMTDINNYQFTLPRKWQHIDIVEIECNTPLLANVYYSYEEQIYSGLKSGDIAIKNLGSKESTIITLDQAESGIFYYSFSLFNSVENPNIIVKFGNSRMLVVNENSLQAGMILKIPDIIAIINNGDSPTRFIFKIGYGVESEPEWIDEDEDLYGKLYSEGNKFVYKFPQGDNRKNFTDLIINVKAMKRESEEEAANIKFCYSTSIGMPIDASLENCFRTGAKIPFSLKFINPLISPKNYKSYSNSYYITLSPYYTSEYISLEITENRYEVKERNTEGVGKIIQLEDEREKSTILSIPEVVTNENANILLQLQLCQSSTDEIYYKTINAYTHEELNVFTLKKGDKFYYIILSGNLMETELKLIGQTNDIVFVKHIWLSNYGIHLQQYKATFDKTQNIVILDKPILDEAFRYTILVGQKRMFDNYSLCTFAEKKESEFHLLADYVVTFTSDKNEKDMRYIDFQSFNYKEGDEFDLLVYAVQINNSKIELLYHVITGTVGHIQDVVKIESTIPGKNDYVTQLFVKGINTNYLYYNFARIPTGYVASLNIKQKTEVEEGLIITNVGCTFVQVNTSYEDMVKEVNNAVSQGTSVCLGELNKDTLNYNALINANGLLNGSNNRRLVIQVMYGREDNEVKKDKLGEESVSFNITLRINGIKVDKQDYGYNEKEDLTLVPYVLDLLEIRGYDREYYISKVLLFSYTREMQIFCLSDGETKQLLSGNIILLYTNEDIIKGQYCRDNFLILLTESFSEQKVIIGEQFRFKLNFFDSQAQIHYYTSVNPEGRFLNNPTSIEMLSCDQPYYYILNYNEYEGDRILHIDNIFGEVNSMKISIQLNDDNWHDFVENMEPLKGNEYYIKQQTKYHFDVLEVTCKIPLLLNLYYTDPVSSKTTNLDKGDITFIYLNPGTAVTLTFKLGLEGEFIFIFNVERSNGLDPNIVVQFGDEDLKIDKNGLFTKYSTNNYPLITIRNKQLTDSDKTKIIFKFGYAIDKTFTKIRNDIYNFQTNDRPANLFGYIFPNGEDRLNYTKVDFRVTTIYENVKFCYSSILGAFIDPSPQDCYTVGRVNSYVISLLNPYVMYKNYYIEEDLDYYISFVTEEIDLNITIYPTLHKYSTDIRNIEGIPNSIPIISNSTSTILTIPANNTKYIFVQMLVCSGDKNVNYEFKNAYNETSLGKAGTILPNNINYFINVENTNLDTLLVFNEHDIFDKETKVFVKHVGVNELYQPTVNEFKITFNRFKSVFNFKKPIPNSEFEYTLFIDREGFLVNQSYTLCSFAEMSKLAHYSETIKSNEENVAFFVNFDESDLKQYDNFDAFILAKEVNNGEMMILSDIINIRLSFKYDKIVLSELEKSYSGNYSSDEDFCFYFLLQLNINGSSNINSTILKNSYIHISSISENNKIQIIFSSKEECPSLSQGEKYTIKYSKISHFFINYPDFDNFHITIKCLSYPCNFTLYSKIEKDYANLNLYDTLSYSYFVSPEEKKNKMTFKIPSSLNQVYPNGGSYLMTISVSNPNDVNLAQIYLVEGDTKNALKMESYKTSTDIIFSFVEEDNIKEITEDSFYALEIESTEYQFITISIKPSKYEKKSYKLYSEITPNIESKYSYLNTIYPVDEECYSINENYLNDNVKDGDFIYVAIEYYTNPIYAYARYNEDDVIPIPTESMGLSQRTINLILEKKSNKYPAICFNNQKKESSFKLEVSHISNTENNVDIYNPLSSGYLYTKTLPKNSLALYTHSSEIHNVDKMVFYLKALKGNPKMYIVPCESYPYCYNKVSELEEDDKVIKPTLTNNIYSYIDDTSNQQDLSPYGPSQKLLYVHCPQESTEKTQICQYEVMIYSNFAEIALLPNEKFYSKLLANENNLYKIHIPEDNEDIKKIKIMYNNSEEVEIKIYEEYLKLIEMNFEIIGNMKICELIPKNPLKNEFDIKFEIEAKKNLYYFIEYQLIRELDPLNYQSLEFGEIKKVNDIISFPIKIASKLTFIKENSNNNIKDLLFNCYFQVLNSKETDVINTFEEIEINATIININELNQVMETNQDKDYFKSALNKKFDKSSKSIMLDINEDFWNKKKNDDDDLFLYMSISSVNSSIRSNLNISGKFFLFYKNDLSFIIPSNNYINDNLIVNGEYNYNLYHLKLENEEKVKYLVEFSSNYELNNKELFVAFLDYNEINNIQPENGLTNSTNINFVDSVRKLGSINQFEFTLKDNSRKDIILCIVAKLPAEKNGLTSINYVFKYSTYSLSEYSVIIRYNFNEAITKNSKSLVYSNIKEENKDNKEFNIYGEISIRKILSNDRIKNEKLDTIAILESKYDLIDAIETRDDKYTNLEINNLNEKNDYYCSIVFDSARYNQKFVFNTVHEKNKNNSKGKNVLVIILISIGAVIALIIILVLIKIIKNRKKTVNEEVINAAFENTGVLEGLNEMKNM